MKKWVFALILAVAVLWAGAGSALAQIHVFPSESIPPEKQQEFLENMGFAVLTEMPRMQSITGFDANDEGLVVVSADDPSNSIIKNVVVLDSEGAFQYGYTFEDYGTIAAEWDEDDVVIHFIRGGAAGWFDKTGAILELRDIPSTAEYSVYCMNVLDATKRTVNGRQYTMTNDLGIFNFFATSYSKLTVTEPDGSVTVIFDTGEDFNIRFALIFTVILGIVVVVVVSVIRSVIESKKPLTIAGKKGYDRVIS